MGRAYPAGKHPQSPRAPERAQQRPKMAHEKYTEGSRLGTGSKDRDGHYIHIETQKDQNIITAFAKWCFLPHAEIIGLMC